MLLLHRHWFTSDTQKKLRCSEVEELDEHQCSAVSATLFRGASASKSANKVVQDLEGIGYR